MPNMTIMTCIASWKIYRYQTNHTIHPLHTGCLDWNHLPLVSLAPSSLFTCSTFQIRPSFEIVHIPAPSLLTPNNKKNWKHIKRPKFFNLVTTLNGTGQSHTLKMHTRKQNVESKDQPFFSLNRFSVLVPMIAVHATLSYFIIRYIRWPNHVKIKGQKLKRVVPYRSFPNLLSVPIKNNKIKDVQ